MVPPAVPGPDGAADSGLLCPAGPELRNFLRSNCDSFPERRLPSPAASVNGWAPTSEAPQFQRLERRSLEQMSRKFLKPLLGARQPGSCRLRVTAAYGFGLP